MAESVAKFFFCVVTAPDCVSGAINMHKKRKTPERAQHPAILAKQAWSGKDLSSRIKNTIVFVGHCG